MFTRFGVKGREGKGSEGKGRERKGREGKGRGKERSGREGKGRKGKVPYEQLDALGFGVGGVGLWGREFTGARNRELPPPLPASPFCGPSRPVIMCQTFRKHDGTLQHPFKGQWGARSTCLSVLVPVGPLAA